MPSSELHSDALAVQSQIPDGLAKDLEHFARRLAIAFCVDTNIFNPGCRKTSRLEDLWNHHDRLRSPRGGKQHGYGAKCGEVENRVQPAEISKVLRRGNQQSVNPGLSHQRLGS